MVKCSVIKCNVVGCDRWFEESCFKTHRFRLPSAVQLSQYFPTISEQMLQIIPFASATNQYQMV